jgi:prepilin-type N-terminal cleavage/methylation domain-containing protein
MNPNGASRTGKTGFTLIEMIGVIAIMAILAAVIAPNALRMLDRAAERAEADTLHNLGEQTKLYLRDNGVPPTTAVPPFLPNWTSQLATYASLNPTDLLTNRRQMIRVYVIDPVAANQRAMFISSMRPGLALGPSTNAVDFAAVWKWNTNDLIASPPPAGWVAWNVANIEFLVVERVNLSSVYRTDLQSFTITLNNKGSVTASYNIVRANGTILNPVDILAGKTAVPSPILQPKDRLNLYQAAGGVTLDYSYMVSTSVKTFDFKDLIFWTPQ